MKSWILGLALAAAFAFSLPDTLLAGTSSSHGGGHSGGGHAGGGHSGGGHGGGHAGAGRSSRGSHARAAAPRAASLSVSSTGRPRDGHPMVGTAVPRMTTISPIVVTSVGYLPSSRWPYSNAWGCGALRFYGHPLGSYGYTGYATDLQDPVGTAAPTGELRLRVEPNDAEVYVDGSFAGIVADFNGAFHHLTLTAGPHRIEIRAPGYQPIVFDVAIQSRHTTQYRGALQR
jgi:hypothetical protein